MSFVTDDPLVISKFTVKSSFLIGSQLQGEPRAHFPQPHFVRTLEVVFVMPEEDVVSLVVEGRYSLAVELRLVVE